MNNLTLALADRYRVERELGQGGMATVYLAQDLRHDRRVALKVLKPELAAVLGAERFVAEIKTTAALQHPHILPLFDSGSADGFLYYVMPFIDGETLRARLDRETQLGIDEAVRITTQVADALDYAHRQGVIHRDIKPENILLHDGRPIVADFGIALALSAAAGGRMTETGLSLGTPHYMSPEQATADRTISPRSDIYSLAGVLHEMLTGNPPHTGASAQQIIMKIVTEDAPSIASVRKSVPPNVAAAVAKALQKLPADRFETASAFARALNDPNFRTEESARPAVGSPHVGVGLRRATAALVLGLVGMAAFAAWAIAREDTNVRDIGLPPNAPLQMAGPFRTYAVSRDGSFIVYLARVGQVTQLWRRSLEGTDARPIPGTDGAGGTPRISPDGSHLIFQVGGDLKLVNLAGGTVTTIGKAQDPHGGEWLANGQLFFADNDGRILRWIDPGAGQVRELGIAYCVNPQLLIDDKVLCGGGANPFAFVISFDKPESKLTIHSSTGSVLVGSHFRVVEDRYLVYMSVDGTLMATSITNPDSLSVGRSVALVPMIRRSQYSGVGQFDVADNGTLTYVPGLNADVGELVRLTRDGRTVALVAEPAAYLRWTPSPDGKRLAAVAQGLQHQELTIFDLEARRRETLDTAFFIGAAAWSPDGSALAYVTMGDPSEETLRLKRLDSPDQPVALLKESPPMSLQLSSWLAPDSLLVGRLSEGGGAAFVDPTRTPAKVDSVGIKSFFISMSPDGKWIAYQTPGVTGIQLQPWPARDRRYLVDAEGTEPRWASSTELMFLSQYRAEGVIAPSVYRARIGTDPRAPVVSKELVVRDPRFADTPGWSTAYTPDGELVYLQSPAENLGYYLRVVPNWVSQMKRAVDAANR